ncbi:hypothetical protein [Oceanobacillus alkalisoli]|uniref:hypothetical protein n=1 Tax=Oceanobacillus alkalisoli TaxID=2925113 RepID=UPI001F120AAF|nr:hypothetical protein [Oceanobacillus alkalisoli]MCF3942163.1 hypothetical protein [Oceanobacillus alkalisoli]
MPKIGNLVLSKSVMKSKDDKETVLVEPFSNIEVDKFPYQDSFTVTVGLFNLKPGVSYDFAYFFYNPTGEKIDGQIFEITADPKGKDKSIHFSIHINVDDIVFREEGVHHVRFQITNLHEEKSTFFYVNKVASGDTDE